MTRLIFFAATLLAAIALPVSAVVTDGAARAAEPGAEGEPSAESVSLYQPMREVKDREALDNLYADLARADDEKSAEKLSRDIWKVWMKSGSDTVDLLVRRAVGAMEAKDEKTAESLLDAVVEIAPNYAEAWNRRATLYFSQKKYARSMADVQRVLALEPRHFGALGGLATMLEETGQDAAALDVYRKALKVHPFLPGARRSVEKLQTEIEGRDI